MRAKIALWFSNMPRCRWLENWRKLLTKANCFCKYFSKSSRLINKNCSCKFRYLLYIRSGCKGSVTIIKLFAKGFKWEEQLLYSLFDIYLYNDVLKMRRKLTIKKKMPQTTMPIRAFYIDVLLWTTINFSA